MCALQSGGCPTPKGIPKKSREERLTRITDAPVAAALRWYPGNPVQSISHLSMSGLGSASLWFLGCGISDVPYAVPQFFGWSCPFHGIIPCRGEGKRDCFSSLTWGLRVLSWDAEDKVDFRGEAEHPTSCRDGDVRVRPWWQWPDRIGPYGWKKLETSCLKIAISAFRESGKPGP